MTRVPLTREIRTRGEFVRVVQEIKAAIAAGNLKQISRWPRFLGGGVHVDELQEGKPWPDIVHMRFKDTQTAKRYVLVVETYHGSGGVWQYESEYYRSD